MSSSKRARDAAQAATTATASAVDALDSLRRTYNRPCSNKPVLDAKGGNSTAEEVAAKLREFCAKFGPHVSFRDVQSQTVMVRSLQALRERYQTVFRESGRGLRMAVHARVVFDAPSTLRDAMVLDLEVHSSLVTPGPHGPRPPREQALLALYHVSDGLVTNVWLSPTKAPAAGDGGDADAWEQLRAREPALHAAVAQQVRATLGVCAARTGPCVSLAVGSFGMTGMRATNEDEIAIAQLDAPRLAGPIDSRATFLGLYDGHGGQAAAKYIGARLHATLGESHELAAGDSIA